MRRIAFIAAMSLGLLGSGWFALQPPAEARGTVRQAAPVIAPVVQVADAADAPLVAEKASPEPAIPVELAQADVLQEALATEVCPSETEALSIVSRVTSTWDFGDAARAIERVSIPYQNCDSVRVALARSRGAVETTTGWYNAPRNPDDGRDTLIVGDGFTVGGDSGPGYRG